MDKEWYFKESEKRETTKDEIKYAESVVKKWEKILQDSSKYKSYSFYQFKAHALVQIDDDINTAIHWEFSEAQPSTEQVLSLCRVRKVIENLKEN